ncbi:MAG: aminopeptidase P family protein, partial [Chloroflexi bacterium]|nr:aminopeptidase P family protein [Chloroflexota bacterium]
MPDVVSSTDHPTRTRKLAISDAERARRLNRVREELEALNLDALVLFHPERIGYLSSFVFVSTERPMALVIPRRGELGMLIPQLEEDHLKKSPDIADVQVYPEYPSGPGGRHPMHHLRELLDRKRLLGRRLGVDSDGYGDVNGYGGPTVAQINGEGSVVLARELVDKLRQVKSAAELDLIRESCTWGNLAHRLLQKHMAIGKTEIEVGLAATSEAILIMLDTLGTSYTSQSRGFRNPPVSASFIAGANTALPHGMRRGQGLRPGDAIITGASSDIGGYHSELERTMIVGEPSSEFAKYFEAMLQIQQAAFAAIRPGRTCGDVEADVQREIAQLGLGHLTRHHTGHGIGLEGHEPPFLDLGDETVLEPGMVFSVE